MLMYLEQGEANYWTLPAILLMLTYRMQEVEEAEISRGLDRLWSDCMETMATGITSYIGLNLSTQSLMLQDPHLAIPVQVFGHRKRGFPSDVIP